MINEELPRIKVGLFGVSGGGGEKVDATDRLRQRASAVLGVDVSGQSREKLLLMLEQYTELADAVREAEEAGRGLAR